MKTRDKAADKAERASVTKCLGEYSWAGYVFARVGAGIIYALLYIGDQLARSANNTDVKYDL